MAAAPLLTRHRKCLPASAGAAAAGRHSSDSRAAARMRGMEGSGVRIAPSSLSTRRDAMSNRTITMNDGLYGYLLDTSLREPPLLKRLRDETAAHPQARMQISPEQGQFMQFLAKLTGARRCIEVGVFTGYSSLAGALALLRTGR